MNAFDFIKQIEHLPMSTERPCTQVSNSELKRWFKKKSILFNGETVDMNEKIDFPVHTIIFFPKGKRRTTM